MQNILEIKSVSHVYRQQFKNEALAVLEDITCEVQKGELIAIVGPSGCGKSSLIRAICGLIQPTYGQILINGLTQAEARKNFWIGFVDQDSTLLPHLTVLDNIVLPMKIASVSYEEEIDWVFDFIGLKDFKNAYPNHLSGGMKQRVALARALILKPKLLLMDEPFSSLDEILRENISLEFAKIQQKLKQTVVFVTHSIDEAVSIADAVIILTPRPARIKDIITLNHLRSVENIRNSNEFFEATKSVRGVLQKNE